MMKKSLYDILKWLQRLILPACVTSFGAIATALAMPNTSVIQSIANGAITFFGALLAVDAASYAKYKSETIKEKIYDILKYAQRIFLPTALTFYGVIAMNLSWPNTELVVSIGNAVIVFLGSVLGVDSAIYYAQKAKLAKIAKATSDNCLVVEDPNQLAFIDKEEY